MQQDAYGSAEDLPGICFGYEINKNSESDFETKFYFQDVSFRQTYNIKKHVSSLIKHEYISVFTKLCIC